MSKRSNWCDYDKETRKYIKKRDENKCILCGSKGATQIMHIFLSRAHGGKGCKENGCLGCVKCHTIIDNPIGNEENKKQKEYLEKCKKHLIEKEGIIYNKDFIETLKYKKEIMPIDFEIKKANKKYDRCKDCKMLVKNKKSNSSIPSYYCKYKKMPLNKSTKACKMFKTKEV